MNPAADKGREARRKKPGDGKGDFAPTLGDVDLHLFAEGRHLHVYRHLGAHVRTLRDSSGSEVSGTSFAVWAPAARRVSVVGDFCDWDGRRLPLRPLGTSGVHERFVPGVGAGAHYKFEVEGQDGRVQLKTDPYARWMEQHPGFASRVEGESTHAWGDAAWMSARSRTDALRRPMAIYEVHLGSWARVPEQGNRSLGYREIAPHLARHVRELGFTHVEFMPLMEHPFGG